MPRMAPPSNTRPVFIFFSSRQFLPLFYSRAVNISSKGPATEQKKHSVPHSTEKNSHRNEIALDRCIFHLQQSRAISGSSWYLTSWLPLFLQIRRHTFAARRIYQRTFLDETLGRPFWLYYNKSGRQFQEPGSTKSRGANYTSLQSLSKPHFCCCLPGFAVIY